MTRDEQIKKILLALIYTNDAKPRFVGGDVDEKIKWIDRAVEEIAEAFNSKKATRADKVIDLICFDDEKDVSIEACKLLLKLDNLEDKTQMLDHVLGDDEYPIEQFEFTFTVQDFLNHIA